MLSNPTQLMKLALLSLKSGLPGEVPISALVFDEEGSVLGSFSNCVKEFGDPTAHAEILAVRAIESRKVPGSARDMTLVVTLEPCPMCAWAIRLSGIGRVVFGAFNPAYGAAGSTYDILRDKRVGKPVEVIGGVLEEECRYVLRQFFSDLRHNVNG